MVVSRREFTQLFTGTSLLAALAGKGAWASNFLTPDPELLMKARDLEFLELGNQRLFQVYGLSGGLCADQMFYLWKQLPKGEIRVLGVRVGLNNIPNGDIVVHARNAVLEGIRRFDAESRLTIEGGDMGYGIRYPEAA